jgi:hypothetical protein
MLSTIAEMVINRLQIFRVNEWRSTREEHR